MQCGHVLCFHLFSLPTFISLSLWPFLYSFPFTHKFTLYTPEEKREWEREIRISNSNFIVIIMRKIISIDSNLSPRAESGGRAWREWRSGGRTTKIENWKYKQAKAPATERKIFEILFSSSLMCSSLYLSRLSSFKSSCLLLFYFCSVRAPPHTASQFSALSLNLSLPTRFMDCGRTLWSLSFSVGGMSWLFVKDIK